MRRRRTRWPSGSRKPIPAIRWPRFPRAATWGSGLKEPTDVSSRMWFHQAPSWSRLRASSMMNGTRTPTTIPRIRWRRSIGIKWCPATGWRITTCRCRRMRWPSTSACIRTISRPSHFRACRFIASNWVLRIRSALRGALALRRIRMALPYRPAAAIARCRPWLAMALTSPWATPTILRSISI